MRWKLLVLVSLVAALVAFGLWSAFAIGLYGSAWAMARSDWRLLASSAAPFIMAAVALVFVYRHTAKRRKLQAVISALLTLLITGVFYCVALTAFPHRFSIPRTSEVRHAR